MVKEYINDEDIIVVFCGDILFIKEEILKRLFEYYIENKYYVIVFIIRVGNLIGYGRIIRDKKGDFFKIVE